MTTPETITLNAGWERCCERPDVLHHSELGGYDCATCGAVGKRREVVLVRQGEGHYSGQAGAYRVRLFQTDEWRLSLLDGRDVIANVFIASADATPEQVANIINTAQLLAALLRVSEYQEER